MGAASIGFVNTQCFREPAIYFEKYGRYDDGEPGTMYNRDYWNTERDRCINGYEVAGVRISGYHYHYLNYTPIIITTSSYGEVHDIKKVHADRVKGFPAFWDVDWLFFTCVDIAEFGVGAVTSTGIQQSLSWEQFNNTPLPLNLIPTANNLGGGHHMLWLKPRGVGFSWKCCGMAERNYACIRESNTFMLANDKTFLTEDGLWSKWLTVYDWQIANAYGLGKRSEYIADRRNMHIEASIKVNGEKKGYLSSVIGVTLKDDWQKARGKRGKLILYEEFGKFPNANKAWGVNRRSMEEGNKVFGLMLGGGTGGTKDANFEALKEMFWDPAASNLLLFDNVYGEHKEEGKPVSLFTPATMNIAFKDADGNSDQKTARAFYDNERELAKAAKDQMKLLQVKAEDPYTPEEAVLVGGKNIFLTDALAAHMKYIETSGLYMNFPTAGKFSRVEVNDKWTLKFRPDPTLKPVYKFPNKLNDSLEGAVLIYYEPYKKNGRVPNNLYKICVDPYEHEDSTGDSIGAIYVIEQPNNFTPTRGDVIVASYIGRPEEGQEKFNEILFQLAEYYGADNGNPYLIAFENDKPGDIGGYATRHRKLHYLADEFQLAFDEEIKTSLSSRRKWGVSMNSGKDDKRRKQGDLFSKAWMYRVRSRTDDGQLVYNFHTVKDLGLLQEWCDYSLEGNRDRHSAFRVGVYHQQELEYEETVPTLPMREDSVSSFFNRDLF
jgi:hypothetical protein